MSDEEIEKYKVCDEHDQKSLTVPEENTKIQLGFGDIYFYFYAIDSEDALRYLNITQPENHARPAMGISIWTQYVLDNFATVREAVDELKKETFRIDAPHSK